MKSIYSFFRSLDPNETKYWIGLVLLFLGLAFSVSVATAMIMLGGVIAAEFVITSYLLTWISWKKK